MSSTVINDKTLLNLLEVVIKLVPEIDTDGDGKISLEELSQASNREEFNVISSDNPIHKKGYKHWFNTLLVSSKKRQDKEFKDLLDSLEHK